MCYALSDSLDLNNTEISITLSNFSSVAENRSLFNRRPSYENMSIIVENDAS